MADLSLVTNNYFPVAHESFSDNLSATILAGANVVPITNLSEYNDGDIVVLTVEPGTVNEATCIGVKQSTPYRLTDVKWTEGNVGVGHAIGATVIDYDSATHYNVVTKGIRQFANNDGTLKTQPVRDALGLGATAVNGWEVLPYTLQVSSGYNKGQREQEITVPNADVRSLLSEGMKLRFSRAITPPTQCADFESTSSQYANKAGLAGLLSSITDDVTVEAFVNLESFPTAAPIFSARTGANGFDFLINSDGTVRIHGILNAGNHKLWSTYHCLNLREWYHLAGSMDMSGNTAAIYINGISVGLSTGHSGTANNFTNVNIAQVGANSASVYFFDGRMTDVRVWSTIRTATQILDNMHQQLTGSETGLIGYWKLAGDFNDSTANANHLAAVGGAIATFADTPFKPIEYGFISKVSYTAPNSTITVFTGNAHTVPNMALTAPYYSTQKSPFGFPTAPSKWRLRCTMRSQISRSYGSGTSVYYRLGVPLRIPIGDWKVYYSCEIGASSSISAGFDLRTTLSAALTDTIAPDVNRQTPDFAGRFSQAWAGTYDEVPFFGQGIITPTAPEDWHIYFFHGTGGTLAGGLRGVVGSQITAECGYL